MICIRCKEILDIECDTKACETCIKYIDEKLICERCHRIFTRTNKSRHYRSYKCRVTIFIEF